MEPIARNLTPREFADYSQPSDYPINEESRRIRQEAQDGGLVLDKNQVITYAGGLMIGYRRWGHLYSADRGGKYMGTDPTWRPRHRYETWITQLIGFREAVRRRI